MSLKETDQVRKNKFFTRWDIAVYLVLLAAVVISFVVLFLSASDRVQIDRLDIRCRGERVAVYDFAGDTLEIAEGREEMFRTEEDGGTLLIYIFPEEGAFNLLAVDRQARTADMRDADCSAGKDCTYMHVRAAGQTIVCVPHGLVIEGVRAEEDGSGGIVIG